MSRRFCQIGHMSLSRQLTESLAGPLDEAADFIDLSKVRSDSKELSWAIIRKFFTSNVAWIRDPKSELSSMRFPKGTGADGLRQAINSKLDPGEHGGGSGFEMNTNDGEIYADGYRGFDGGEWGYRSSQAEEAGILKALQANPPTVKVEAVKGSTGGGWKITISKPYSYYKKAGDAAAVIEQEKMVAKGMKKP